MNPLSFLATIALAVSMIEGIYILSRDYKSEENRLFFLICLSISIWLFGGSIGYSAATRNEAFFWLKITSPGFIFMHAFVLHFAIRYTGFIKTLWIYLLYLPSLIFLYISISNHLVFSDIYRSGNYWVMVPDYESLTFYLFMINYLSYYFISLFLLHKQINKTDSKRIQSQSRIIFAAIIITITSYNIEPFLAPLCFNYLTYGQAPLYSILWVSLIWYAMYKYRFLGIYKQYLPFDFIDSLNKMVIITDPNELIVKVNRTLKERISPTSPKLYLEDIFIEHELLRRQLASKNDKNSTHLFLNLKLTGEQQQVVKVSISDFKDRFGDTVGYIILLQETSKTQETLKKHGITKREHQLIELILSGNTNQQIADTLNISMRTVETHITSIYSKLGLERRSELINYCTGIY